METLLSALRRAVERVNEGHGAMCFIYQEAGGICDCGYEAACLDIIEPAFDTAEEIERLTKTVKVQRIDLDHYKTVLAEANDKIERLRCALMKVKQQAGHHPGSTYYIIAREALHEESS